MLDREFIKMLDREFIKGHLHCKTIISEKVSFEALVKNFFNFVVMFLSQDI